MVESSEQAAVVFPADATASGPRVRLSHLDTVGLEAMSSWLAPALLPEWRFEDLERRVAAGRAVLVSDAAGVPIGAAVALLGVPVPGAACVPFISVEPSRRFRGLGGEAGLALERYLRAHHGVERVYAPVPDGRGLGVYFWLRLGYRALTRTDAPWPLTGLSDTPVPGIWMVRESP